MPSDLPGPRTSSARPAVTCYLHGAPRPGSTSLTSPVTQTGPRQVPVLPGVRRGHRVYSSEAPTPLHLLHAHSCSACHLPGGLRQWGRGRERSRQKPLPSGTEILGPRLADVFRRGPDSKYFRLRRPAAVCSNHSAVAVARSSHG